MTSQSLLSMVLMLGMVSMLPANAALPDAPFLQGDNYGASLNGAVSDKLFYSIGGGSVISTPGTMYGMKRIGLDASLSSDLMCGNFDIKTTVGNQLNGVTSGFKDLMGDVVTGATGAVASMPAMILQRANPGLYEMITNGVLQAGLDFDKSKLNCESMANKLADYTLGDKSSWTESAVREEYKDAVSASGGDAVRAEEARTRATGKDGTTWVGGKKAGGKGQPAIQPTHDLARAGYNMMNNLGVTSNATVSQASCKGSACQKFKNSEEAAQAVVRILGDRSIRTCKDATECGSGGPDNAPGSTIAGTGFAPLLEDTTQENLEQLIKLVNGSEAPTQANLAKIKSGSLQVTRGVIDALRRDPDAGALVRRLAGELAMSDVIETALAMRRMLTTGQSEPNAADQPQAMAEADRRVEALDREIKSLRMEMELRHEVAKNAAMVAVAREENRAVTNPQKESQANSDTRLSELETRKPGSDK
ncbi:integrating conjugative element protein [Salmonella enterica subsp. enterica]|nr:integrating conjugative element protein [Salmonella enterica subsp. enterica serovar Hvittingfoss]